jgi:hypothetical protein
MKKPFFTIAIPTCNRADYLAGCLAGLTAQTFPDFEIIIADNASTDNTREIVESMGDPRISYIRHGQNIGAYENFIYCSTLGTGEFLILHQDDDLLHADFLKRCHAVATAHPELAVYGSAALSGDAATGYSASVLPDLLASQFDWPLREEPMVVDGRRMAVRFLFSHCMNHPAIALRRSALVAAGGYGPSADCYCDLVTIPRVMAQGAVAYDPRMGGLGRVHAAQFSTRTSKQRRAQMTHQTFCYQVDSLKKFAPNWPEVLVQELASQPVKKLMPLLKDLNGFHAPPELTRLVWDRCREGQPNRPKLLRLLLSRIGVKNTLRLLARI